MKLLYIGNITGPFGIKGEVKVLSETNHKNEIFKVGNNLYIDNKKYNYIKVCDIIIPLMDNYIEKLDFDNNVIYVKNMGDLYEN